MTNTVHNHTRERRWYIAYLPKLLLGNNSYLMVMIHSKVWNVMSLMVQGRLFYRCNPIGSIIMWAHCITYSEWHINNVTIIMTYATFALVTLSVCCGLIVCVASKPSKDAGNESKPGGSMWLIPLMQLLSQTSLQGWQQGEAWKRESQSTKLYMSSYFYPWDNRQIKWDRYDSDTAFAWSETPVNILTQQRNWIT